MDPSLEPVALLRGAVVRYGDHTEVALPDLELSPGEEAALVGPSGSRKTTLLHLLAGLVRPSRGEARAAGLDLASAGPATLETYRARSVGLMFQDFHPLEGFTALEQVVAVLGLAGVPLRDAGGQARVLLERVGLGGRLRAAPARLSTGERQRVALARALATRPRLLLVDEPTAHLDSARAELALELLRALAREAGAAMLIATHDPVVIATSPRRVAVGGLAGSAPREAARLELESVVA